MYLGVDDPRNAVPLKMDPEDARYNCLMAGTPVVLADYSTMLIEDIVRRRLPVDVLAWTRDRGIHSARVYDWHKNRVPGQEWLRIRLARMAKTTRGLVLTPDHEVFVDDGKPTPADLLQAGQTVSFPEIRLSDALEDALHGTLLGDTRLVVAPAYRENWHEAHGAALDGGHVESSGLSQYKAQVFAGHAMLSPLQPANVREIAGKLTEVQPFRPWRTNGLYGLNAILRKFYDTTGARIDPLPVVERLGVLGWAWWFMDDGCLQKIDGRDGVTLALCRYSEAFALAVRDIARQRWGMSIYVGADRVLRFAGASAVAFAKDIAPHVLPTVRYKLPRDLWMPPFLPLQAPMLSVPVPAEIESVTRYVPKMRTPSERLKAETRFCISVEGAGNFFTSFGLVKNCRDVLGMCRAYPSLHAMLQSTATENVYEMDRQLARIALQMKRAGLPVDMEERARVRQVLVKLRDDAEARLLPYTQGDNFDAFVGHVCLMQARTVRKDEPAAGTFDAMGLPMSAEEAQNLRIAIRKEEFLKSLEKSVLRKTVWEWLKFYTFNTQNTGGVVAPDAVVLAEKIGVEAKVIAAVLRGFSDRKFIVEAPTGGFRVAEHVDEDDVLDAIGGINVGAKMQQAAILLVAGVPLLRVTEKSGALKIDKEILEENGHHQAARDLLAYTLTAAAVANFIDGIVPEDIAVASDGKRYGAIHPDWMVHKITGRWGSSPNVQNWSKRAGGGVENIRAMIAAPPEEIFIGADYAQLEARLLAAMSQDEFLLDIFRNKKDIHLEFGKLAFPVDIPALLPKYVAHKKGTACGLEDPRAKCKDCKHLSKLRDLTKRLEYGGFYGGSVETLWQSVVKDAPDLELATVRSFLAEVNRTCNGLRRFQAAMLNHVARENEIRSPILGRRQVFPMNRVDPTVVSNFPNQSGGADFWGIGALRFCARYDQRVPVGQGPRLIHNGHDSVLVRAPRAMAEEVKAAVEQDWYHFWQGVEFPVEADIGQRWSQT